MKSKLKIGCRVKHKHLHEWGVGEVVENNAKSRVVVVRWPSQVGQNHWIEYPEELELVETPIERMRRRYNEK